MENHCQNSPKIVHPFDKQQLNKYRPFGHIHTSLGSNKVFHCPQCGLTIDRDMNGARNILIRFLTTNHIEPY